MIKVFQAGKKFETQQIWIDVNYNNIYKIMYLLDIESAHITKIHKNYIIIPLNQDLILTYLMDNSN